MLVKFLETYNNFAANFEFSNRLLPNVGLQILKKCANTIVLYALEHPIFEFLRVEIRLKTLVKDKSDFVYKLRLL